MDEVSKVRKTPSRKKPMMDAHSSGADMPMSSTCGHSGCSSRCEVRYVGPTSPISAHHALHASRGIAHVWSASIISGLAVVLTGVIAYSSIQGGAQAAAYVSPAAQPATRGDVTTLSQQIQQLQQEVLDLKAICSHTTTTTNAGTGYTSSSARGW